MSTANPNLMEKAMVLLLVVANAGGGHRCHVFRDFDILLEG
jgi:hypothetical protein